MIKKRDFIQDKLKLLLISDVSFTPPIPLPPTTAGLELAFEAKGAGALQKGQWPFCKGLTHNCQYETFCCEIHIWSRTCHAEDFWNIGILVKMIHHNQVSRQNKATKTNSNLTRNYKIMHIESLPKSKWSKKRLYSWQTKVIAHFRLVIHTTNSTPNTGSWIRTRVWSKGSWCPAKGAMTLLQKL